MSIWREFSITARSFGSDSRKLAVLPGAMNFFSFSLATASGLKSMKTSLKKKKKIHEGTSEPERSGDTSISMAGTNLKLCLLLRIVGQVSSDNALENTSNSNNFL